MYLVWLFHLVVVTAAGDAGQSFLEPTSFGRACDVEVAKAVCFSRSENMLLRASGFRLAMKPTKGNFGVFRGHFDVEIDRWSFEVNRHFPPRTFGVSQEDFRGQPDLL